MAYLAVGKLDSLDAEAAVASRGLSEADLVISHSQRRSLHPITLGRHVGAAQIDHCASSIALRARFDPYSLSDARLRNKDQENRKILPEFARRRNDELASNGFDRV
jgi:hypothetical protein